MDTTQMGMVILAPYSRQVPRNSSSIHFLRRGLRGFKNRNAFKQCVALIFNPLETYQEDSRQV